MPLDPLIMLLQTGIRNLDKILGGGIPERDAMLIIGPAGSGKTTLTFQIAFHVLKSQKNVIYISTVSESPERLVEHIRTFSFFDNSLVGSRLFILNAYPLLLQGLDKVLGATIESARTHRPKVIVIDGLLSLRSLHPDELQMRAFLYELSRALAALDAVLLITSSILTATETLPEHTMADGILEMGIKSMGTRTQRTIRSAKMRSLPNLLGQHSMEINQDGIQVFPRIESLLEFRDLGLSLERVALGLPELDALMWGGSLAGKHTLIAGATGTGKTLVGLQFLLEGARKGEKGLYIGFRESPRELTDMARYAGMDLNPLIQTAHLEIWHRVSVDLNIDGVSCNFIDQIKRFLPRRIVIDSIAELEHAFLDQERQWGYMSTLGRMLRNEGATSLIVKDVPQAVGPELDFSDTPLATLTENVIFFRYVQFREELYRVLSILKMSGSSFDPSIRQYQISDQGILVLKKGETDDGVLSGITRLPSELRVKRQMKGA